MSVQVAFRFPESLVARLDAYAQGMRESNPGVTVSRADAARLLLNQALDGVEAAAKRKRA